MARPEPERLKAHEIAFDDAAGAKNRGAIAQEPDGRFRGVIAQSDGRSKGVIEEPAAKDKATILPPPTPSTKEKGFMETTQPAPQDKAHFDLQPKDKAIILDSASPKERIIGPKDMQEKGHFIPPPPPKEGIIPSEKPTPPKSSLPAVQAPSRQEPIVPKTKPGPPSKDHRCDHFVSPPSRDEAIDEQLINPPAPQAPAPGPQSLRPGVDYSLLLTQEQKDHVVMGIRDRLWTLNAEGKLERRLAGGVRAIMREGGWVEVYNAEGHLLSAYQDVRAERIDRATRITERMKRVVLKMKG
jgi:hypothetical protein